MYNLTSSITIALCSTPDNKEQFEYVVNPLNLNGRKLLGSLMVSVIGNNKEDVEFTQVYSQGLIPVDKLLEMMEIGSEICTSLYTPMQRQYLKEYAVMNNLNEN